MTVSAFTSSFTPTLHSSASFTGAAVCPSVRAHAHTQAPVAVLDLRRTSSSTFGVQTQTQTYTVKVVEPNKCTTIEVERDTDLRQALLDNKIDVYTLRGKMTNCGGGGACGTCMIAVEDGYTNGRSMREERLLRDRPANWRLACQTTVTSDVTIQTKPQR